MIHGDMDTVITMEVIHHIITHGTTTAIVIIIIQPIPIDVITTPITTIIIHIIDIQTTITVIIQDGNLVCIEPLFKCSGSFF